MSNMPRVGWQEKDIEDLRDDVKDDGVVQDILSWCGLMKFF